jgi:HD-like signal output (HDOD) protein
MPTSARVLAIKWFLPEDLTIAIRYHHAPERDPFHKALSGLICLSDLLSSTNERPSVQSAYVNEIGEELYELVGIDPADLEDLLAKANEEFAGTGMPWS